MFYVEVWDDSIKGKEKIVKKHEFNTLIEAQKAFYPIQDINDTLGFDYAYFISDENDMLYDSP